MGDVYEYVDGYDNSNAYSDDMVFEVSKEDKSISVIKKQILISGERNSQYIEFQMPRYYDGIDLSEKNIEVIYVTETGVSDINKVINVRRNEEQILFGWLVPGGALQDPGTLSFCIEFAGEEYVMKTMPVEIEVYDGMNGSDIMEEPTDQVWYMQIQNLCSQTLEKAQEHETNAATSEGNAQTYMQDAQEANEQANQAKESIQGAVKQITNNRLSIEELEKENEQLKTRLDTAVGNYTGSEEGEIADARIDRSGKVYGALGAAIRGQLDEQEDKLKKETDSLKEDLGGLLHHPKEYWTMGDIDVPITGEWSNKQVKCEVDLSDMVGNVLKVSVGSISDSIDTHYCYINLLDEKENNISDGHVRENTFIKGVIPTSGGYTSFDISSIRNSVKYIKVQAQAYKEIKPTITGTIKYSGISAKDDSDKIAFIAEVNKSNLSNNLKNELHLSDSNGAVIKNVGTVNPDTTVTITSNNIKKNKTLIVNAKINSFEKITVGHGIDVYGGAYLEVTPSELNVYNYSTQAKLVKTVSHSLTIANDIYIEVTNSVSKYGFHARIKIVSQGKSFVQSGTFDFSWTGSNGDVFIKTGTNTALSDCKVSWSCSDLSANIHAFGDSYFDYWNPKMADLGYSDRFLFDGFGGRTTLQAIAPLNFSLQHGTPKYVLWCLGMNNPDNGVVNSDWLSGFNKVITACKDKGIIPIFATIPNTPKNNNSYKNTHIKSSGYRYVDIAHYVGADEVGSGWHDGLLSTDNVHPTDKGAYIIAQNIIIDLADIIFGN